MRSVVGGIAVVVYRGSDQSQVIQGWQPTILRTAAMRTRDWFIKNLAARPAALLRPTLRREQVVGDKVANHVSTSSANEWTG